MFNFVVEICYEVIDVFILKEEKIGFICNYIMLKWNWYHKLSSFKFSGWCEEFVDMINGRVFCHMN